MANHTFILLMTFFLVHIFSPTPAGASHESEKTKIYNKFEVVSFGPSERLTDNLWRIYKACAGNGTSKDSLEVYKKRYKELKSHWDDAEKKFKENKVDTNSEPVYVGFIDWVQKSEVLPGAPQVPTDHFIQFYVAARKQDKNKDDDPAVETGAKVLRPISLPEGVAKSLANQRWRFIDTTSKGEYIVEWFDPAKDAWSNLALDYDTQAAVVLKPLDKSAARQRWLIEEAGDNTRLLVSVRSKEVLDYVGDGEQKYSSNLKKRLGNHGRFGQKWMIMKTPTRDEIGLWNTHAKRYLGVNLEKKSVACEE